jgi:hypothetical protein
LLSLDDQSIGPIPALRLPERGRALDIETGETAHPDHAAR